MVEEVKLVSGFRHLWTYHLKVNITTHDTQMYFKVTKYTYYQIHTHTRIQTSSQSFVHKRKRTFKVSTYQQRLILSLFVWMKHFRLPRRRLPVQPAKRKSTVKHSRAGQVVYSDGRSWVRAQCLRTHLQVRGSKRLGCHADLYRVSRCHTRGESKE